MKLILDYTKAYLHFLFICDVPFFVCECEQLGVKFYFYWVCSTARYVYKILNDALPWACVQMPSSAIISKCEQWTGGAYLLRWHGIQVRVLLTYLWGPTMLQEHWFQAARDSYSWVNLLYPHDENINCKQNAWKSCGEDTKMKVIYHIP